MGKMVEDTIYNAFLLAVCAAAIYLIAMMAGGCQPISKQAQAQINTANDAAAIAANAAKHAADLAIQKAHEASEAADQAALDNPIRHPIRAIGLTVKQDRPIFNRVAVACTLLAALAFGIAIAVRFVSFVASLIGQLGSSLAVFFGIVFSFVGVVCWVLLWFGPVAPEIALVLLLIAGIVLLVKLHNNGWKLSNLFEAHKKTTAVVTTIAEKTGTPIPPGITFGKSAPASG